MTAVPQVPAGTRLHLHPGEANPDPQGPVWTVAVYPHEVGGRVWVRGHVCAGPDPDCGGGWCFEGQVALSAIRANVAGAR